MPHVPLPDEIPDEDTHVDRDYPVIPEEEIAKAEDLLEQGKISDVLAVLAEQGDRYAELARDFGPVIDLFATEEERTEFTEGYLGAIRAGDGRVPTQEVAFSLYAQSLRGKGKSLPEQFRIAFEVMKRAYGVHPDRDPNGTRGSHSLTPQEQTAAMGDTTPGVLNGPGEGVNPGFSLQHDLGRDGNGNDDTSQNPDLGGRGNNQGYSGLQHDLGSDGYGNDDTSQNPSSNSNSNDAAAHGDTTPGSQFGQEESGEGLDPGEEDPGGDGDGDSGGGGGKPIVLDLDGDGVELVALDDSTAFYDINGDGYRERMAWASADDGFLAYDKDSDGAISEHDELSFVSYVDGARTDLEGLAHFDTNGNGQLDSGDAEWSKFRVWQDLDQDGVSDPGELRTLAEAGITSISLTSDGVEQTVAGNTVFGEGSYTDGEGSQSFFDVALQHSKWGIREDADGNIIVGSGSDALLHIAGPTTEAERRLDASVLGVAGIVGHDTADHLTAAAEGSLLVGAGGNDTLVGGEGNDWLQGNAGADTILGGGGSDILVVDADDFATGEVDGGAGFDVAIVSGDTGVTVDLAAHGLEAILGGGGDDTFSSSGTESVVMFGEGGSDTLTGGAGNDLLSGGDGADTLRAGAGDDVLFVDADDFATGAVDGGAGEDIAFVEGDTGVTVDLATHNLEVLFGSEGDDTLSTSGATGVLIDGGAGNDTITGSAANDSLFGSAGDDTLIGSGGNDILDGGAGTDTLRGGSGNDQYRFGRGGGRDTVRDEHLVNGQAAEAGTGDVLFLHGDIGIDDILIRLTANGLEIALKDPDDPDAAFDDLADRVTIENWSNDFSKIETIAFGDGSRLNLKELATTYNITVGGAVVDLIAAMTAAYTGTVPTGGSAYLGGAGDDRLVGGDTGDVVSGGDGDDILSGGDGDDTLLGGADGDVLWGGVGIDALKGGAGDDLYSFGRGDGRDTVRDEHVVDGQAAEAGTGDILYLHGEIGIGDILLRLTASGLEIALKDPDDPDATFDDLVDRVTIENWSNDFSKIETIVFGDGSRLNLKEIVTTYNVTLGGAVVDLIAAMTAAYTGTVPTGGHAYVGGAGDDVLVGGDTDDVVSGGTGNDIMSGGAGDDTLEGGAGEDVLWGGAGDDTLKGGAGNDRYAFGRGGGRETVRDEHIVTRTWRERSGSYTAYRTERVWEDYGGEGGGYWTTRTVAYTVYTYTTRTADEAQEAGAADVLYLHGDIGIDDILLRLTASGLEIALKDSDDPDAAFDDLADRVMIENWSNDFSKIEVLVFGDGSVLNLKDLVTTYNVTLGGAVVDLIAAMTAAYTGTVPTGGHAYVGGADDDVMSGGDGDDVVVGGGGDDALAGAGGNDTVYGGVGDDTLYGGDGDDRLEGGAGADALHGGGGRDAVSYAGSSAGVTVDLSAGTASGGDAEGDTFSDIEDVTGSDHDDTLNGDEGANRLTGGAGRDTLRGRAGADHLYGGDGNDRLYGDEGADHLFGGAGSDTLYVDAEDLANGSFDGGDGIDTVDVGTDAGVTIDLGQHNLEIVQGGAGNDNFSQSGSSWVLMSGYGGDDTLSGGSAGDYLFGGTGDDVLQGNGGRDKLFGDGGNDRLTGGTGDDIYEFGRGDGADTIDNRGEGGSDDVLEFDRGIDADQLWFSRSGDDLVVRIVGTEDGVTIEDWYDGPDNRLGLELDDGRVLLAENVNRLVDAMAAFTPPGAGETEFTPAQRTTLDPIVAANWQTAA